MLVPSITLFESIERVRARAANLHSILLIYKYFIGEVANFILKFFVNVLCDLLKIS